MKKNNPCIVLLALILASCAGTPECFSPDVFCAAVVTDTLGFDDHGLNAGAWLGLQDAKTDGVVDEIAFIESVDVRDYEKNVAYFASRGYDAIITVNPGMSRQTLQATDVYPDSIFVGLNQTFEESRPNLIPVSFAEDQMGFLAGTLAAALTETRAVGAVCESSGFDAMWRYCEGFRNGVLYKDKDIRVTVLYREGEDREKIFSDEPWGYENGLRLIRGGADVIFAAGGATGQGALHAGVENEIYVIGSERDQAGALGETTAWVVTSVYGDAQAEIHDLMRLIREGNPDMPWLGRIKFVPLDGKFPESLSLNMAGLLNALQKLEVQTSVPLTKP